MLIMVWLRQENLADVEATTCTSCGTPAPSASRYCPGCGTEIVAFQAGEVLDGKYEILGKLAEGGMGEVYRAKHLHLDEVRIIKVMKAVILQDQTQQRRFAEEARLATRIRHPNVAALYDFSKLPNGRFYMVWEFIDGRTLLQLLRAGGPIPAPEALDIAIQVLNGLAEIHRAGVVHRDISPDNIMILSKGRPRIAKIIDLGIAKQVAEDRAGMTTTGMFLGKLKYCSPEQAGAMAEGERLDGRSDIYSFGAVLYEMLSGQPLFQSPTPEGYLVKHLQEPPPPLPAAMLPADIGPQLSAVVARAIEKDRTKRFQSASEFAQALTNLRAGTATAPTVALPGRASSPAAAPLERQEPTTILLSRRKFRAGLWIAGLWIAGLVVALGIAGGIYAWLHVREAAPQHAAEPPASTAPAAAAPPTSALLPPTTSSPMSVSATTTMATPPLSTTAPRIVEENKRLEAKLKHDEQLLEQHRQQQAAPSEPPPETEVALASPSTAATAETAGTAMTTSTTAASPGRSPVPDESAARAQLGRLLAAARSGRPQPVNELVNFVNVYVVEHAGSPLANSIQTTMPDNLKRDALAQLELRHPGKARGLLRLYKALSFAPDDPAVDRYLAILNQRLPQGKQGNQEPGQQNTGNFAGGFAGDGPLEHTPVTSAVSGADIRIKATWPGPVRDLHGEVFFRNGSSGNWNKISLDQTGPNSLRGVIPGNRVGPPEIDYYIVAHAASGTTRRNGSPDNPIRVRVREN